LREAGWRVAISAHSGRNLVAESTRLEAAEALFAADDGRTVRLDRAGEPAMPLEDPPPYPPTQTWAAGGEAR
jgi:hypothetical protein